VTQALLSSDPSHPAYGRGVRRLRRLCRNFALLPTSFSPISIHNIHVEPKQPVFTTGLSDVFRGTHGGTKIALKVLRVCTGEPSLDVTQKVIFFGLWRHASAHVILSRSAMRSSLGAICVTATLSPFWESATSRLCASSVTGWKREHYSTSSASILANVVRLM
jgi:hypothetical protein